MLLIPLGFGRKIPRAPFLTVAIAVLILAISVPYFGRVAELERLKATSMKESGYDQKLIAFAKVDCVASQLTSEQCGVLERMLKAYFADESPEHPGVRQELQKLKKSDQSLVSAARDFERVGHYYARLLDDPRQFNASAKQTTEYDALMETHAAVEDAVLPVVRDQHFLTARNRRISALMLAQWLHANWSHLLGNLIVFLIFGAILEARLGPWPVALIYVAGGTLGLGAQMLFLHDSLGILVGASANVSAVIGAFFVYFFYRPMRVLFSLIVYNRMLDVPTWIVVTVFFVGGDIVGALDGGGNVAHLAHLVGFATGAALAWIFKQAESLDAAYLYPKEYDWHVEMRKAQGLPEKIAIAERILTYNADNHHIRIELIEQILFGGEMGAGREYLETSLAAAVELGLRRRDLARLDRILSVLPLDYSFIDHLKLSQRALLTLSAHHLRIGNWFVALRLYDVFRYHYAKASTAQSIDSTVRNLLDHLRSNHTELSILNAYLVQERRTTLTDLVAGFSVAPESEMSHARSG